MRTFAWTVRRELWEHRSLLLAPAAVAILVLLGFVMTASGLEVVRRLDAIDPARQAAMLARPYEGAAIILMATSIVVAVFYCLDALHCERRDRSILFWKSLPVSDRIAVLAKCAVPLVAVPVVTILAVLATQLVMLLVGTGVLIFSNASAAPLWSGIPHARNTAVLLYTVATMALWHAPLYAWCLAASAAAPRAPLLFAVLPWLAAMLIEMMALGSNGILTLLRTRITGSFDAAFSHVRPGASGVLLPPQAVPDIGRYVATPGLWWGLLVATVLVAACIALRRRALVRG